MTVSSYLPESRWLSAIGSLCPISNAVLLMLGEKSGNLTTFNRREVDSDSQRLISLHWTPPIWRTRRSELRVFHVLFCLLSNIISSVPCIENLLTLHNSWKEETFIETAFKRKKFRRNPYSLGAGTRRTSITAVLKYFLLWICDTCQLRSKRCSSACAGWEALYMWKLCCRFKNIEEDKRWLRNEEE